MGPHTIATLERHGFYPAGGGQFTVTIEPCPALAGFDLLERGPLRSCSACAIIANLPEHIAEREVKTMLHEMSWEPNCGRILRADALGRGNVAYIELCSQSVTEIFTAFGRIGVRAEQVAEDAARQARCYLQSNAAVGPQLADQLILPLGISAWQPAAGGRQRGGSFRTLPLTQHTTTHIEILRQFLGVEVRVEDIPDGTCRVSVYPEAAA
jgi:RNA 3'-terminal phosphate cyclase (ATP)